jgi:nicotinamidase-related amidase
VLVFNCTHERDPAQLLAPLAALHATDAGRFEVAFFTPNIAGPAAAATPVDQTDLSVPADAVAALTEQGKMRELWEAACAPGTTAAQVVPSVADALAAAEAVGVRRGRPVQVVVTGSLLLGGVAAGVLHRAYGVDLISPPPEGPA